MGSQPSLGPTKDRGSSSSSGISPIISPQLDSPQVDSPAASPPCAPSDSSGTRTSPADFLLLAPPKDRPTSPSAHSLDHSPRASNRKDQNAALHVSCPALPATRTSTRTMTIPAKLSDYDFNNIWPSSKIIYSSSVSFTTSARSGKFLYPITHLANYVNFPPSHQHFLASVTAEIEPYMIF